MTAPTLPVPAGSPGIRRDALERMSRPDFPAWLNHVRPAAGCSRPVRLVGDLLTVEASTGRLLSRTHTDSLPDQAVYKACGNRRQAVCPSCSARYKRDAYQLVRAGLVGGRGVPEHVATHPAVFPTFTAPSFGPVHTRYVKHHTCTSRRHCDCRPDPCHARTGRDVDDRCPHGRTLVCFARHAENDKQLGSAMCPDCYDYHGQVVWNLQAGELWRRTSEAIRKYLRRLAMARGIDPNSIKVAFGKAAEMQRRAVVHYHGILRLDGADPDDKKAILPPPPGIDAQDLVDAVEHAARVTGFTTDPHPAKPAGWRIEWGGQTKTRIITMAGNGEVTDGMVAAYIAKYATKSTEVTGHVSGRLNDTTVNLYADPDGTHTERLVEACWILGAPKDWRRLRRWAHMFGFGGHFFTKSRTYSITFTILRQRRVVFRRTELAAPQQQDGQVAEQPTTLVVNFLQFVGAGWHTTADAMLANTSAALAREHDREAQQQMAAIAS